jgi:hypothetical protein
VVHLCPLDRHVFLEIQSLVLDLFRVLYSRRRKRRRRKKKMKEEKSSLFLGTNYNRTRTEYSLESRFGSYRTEKLDESPYPRTYVLSTTRALCVLLLKEGR